MISVNDRSYQKNYIKQKIHGVLCHERAKIIVTDNMRAKKPDLLRICAAQVIQALQVMCV